MLLIWLLPPALYGYVKEPKDRAATEASTRTGLIAGLAGLAALISVSYTARTYRLTEHANRVAEQGHFTDEQGHFTDRYTKAIDQLGSDKLDVRLGSIYALERIADDSPGTIPL